MLTHLIGKFDYEGNYEGFLDLYLGNKLVGAWSDTDSGLIAVHTFENVKATDAGNLRLVAEAPYGGMGDPELDIDIDYVTVAQEVFDRTDTYSYDCWNRMTSGNIGGLNVFYKSFTQM